MCEDKAMARCDVISYGSRVWLTRRDSGTGLVARRVLLGFDLDLGGGGFCQLLQYLISLKETQNELP
jgi:hypothetical protein